VRTLRNLSDAGARVVLLGVAANSLLAVVKVAGGIWGHSNALLADGLESALDVVSSALIWGALRYAGKPPDEDHPYGHGKIESLAAVAGAVFLIGAGAAVALRSIGEIWKFHSSGTPVGELPSGWTLIILLAVIAIKEVLYRLLSQVGREISSVALRTDAWHHRSDALTSLAAFIGISLTLIGGPAWQSADNWAALFSCSIIISNGLRMLKASVGEVMDEKVSEDIIRRAESIARDIPGVFSAEKCRIRKSGLTLLADLHVRVNGSISVFEGHRISHEVKDRLIASDLHLSDVTVHIEPEPDVPHGA
jgi:cation diffusion facilitator family transporter